MTEELKPSRAYQPWTDGEYELLARLSYTYKMTVNQIAGAVRRLPSEVENALIKLKFLNEAMTDKQGELTNGVCDVYKTEASILYKMGDILSSSKNYPEHLIDHYGSGLRPLNAVHKAQAHVNTADRGKELSIHDMDTIPPWDRGLTEEGYKAPEDNICHSAQRMGAMEKAVREAYQKPPQPIFRLQQLNGGRGFEGCLFVLVAEDEHELLVKEVDINEARVRDRVMTLQKSNWTRDYSIGDEIINFLSARGGNFINKVVDNG